MSLILSPSSASPSSSNSYSKDRRLSNPVGRNNHCVSEFFVVVAHGSLQEVVSSSSNDDVSAAATVKETKHSPLPPFIQWLNDFRFKGEVVDRYPMATVSASGTQFPDGIPIFCMPSGLIISTAPPPPSYFAFVTTASSGERLYGHCLTIHDPMSLELIAMLQKQYDALVEQQSISLHGTIASDESDILKSSSETSSSPSTPSTPTIPSTPSTPTTPFFSSSSSSSLPPKQLFASKCLCLVTKFPFLVQCHDFLTSLYQITMSINDGPPIERYICNFINEVPLPPPGKAEVQYGIADKTLIFTRPPLNQPILDVDLPFRRVFECLTPSTIITLFNCLLLESKILMHSYQLR